MRFPIISPSAANTPIMPVMRWEVAPGGSFYKKFKFKTNEERNRFICDVLVHEESCGHYAAIKIVEKSVSISLITRELDIITELDKEFAREVDKIYKDVTETYISLHGERDDNCQP